MAENNLKQFEKNPRIPMSEALNAEDCVPDPKEKIVFSFSRLTTCKEYNFGNFKKKNKGSNAASIAKSLVEKLKTMSNQSWDEFYAQERKHGGENLDVSEMAESFLNGLDPRPRDGEKLVPVRFNCEKSRFIIKRAPGASNVAYVLGIDCDLSIYKHGN